MLIYNWIINSLIFSLPLTWYIIFNLYKDCKRKDKVIETLTNIVYAEKD